MARPGPPAPDPPKKRQLSLPKASVFATATIQTNLEQIDRNGSKRALRELIRTAIPKPHACRL